MKQAVRGVLILAIGALCLVPVAFAQTEIEGTTAGGAFYKIVVPDGWNGDGLVIWNHGFSLNPIGPVSDLGVLVDVQLSEGFAVAASSYRMPGWALFKVKQDLEGLVTAFRNQVGNPDQIIITGASLGGAMTAAALQKANLGNVTGAYMFCGAVGGSRSWDGALDLRLLYEHVCGDIPGASIEGAATGLASGSTLSQVDILTAVNICTGVSLPKKNRTKTQKNNLARLVELTRLPESFIETDMIFATQGLGDLIHDRQKLKGKQGVGNADVDYGDDEVNANIERVKTKKRAAKKLKKNFTPNGTVKGAKVVSIHTDKDGLVIVENEAEYAAQVAPENLTTAIVVESAPSHCGFTIAEVLSGWESLLLWLDTGVQPTAQDIDNNCEALAPIFGGPCRFDPNFEIPPMDARVRPR